MEVSARTAHGSGKSALVDCLRSGLALTGVANADVIEYHLAARFGVKLEDVPDQPSRFVETMLETFGEGAKPIFLSILRELLLCSSRGVEFAPLSAALTRALGAPASARAATQAPDAGQ